MDFVLTPSNVDKNWLQGVTFGVAEISVSFNHGGGGEWWGGFVVCDTNTYGKKFLLFWVLHEKKWYRTPKISLKWWNWNVHVHAQTCACTCTNRHAHLTFTDKIKIHLDKWRFWFQEGFGMGMTNQNKEEPCLHPIDGFCYLPRQHWTRIDFRRVGCLIEWLMDKIEINLDKCMISRGYRRN
jgi:hypothetical protein